MAEGICIIGIIEVDNGKIKSKKLFPKDPEKIAKELEKEGQYDKETSEYLNKNLRKIAKELKYVKDDRELNDLIRKVQIIRTKKKIGSKERKDKLIVASISAQQDLEKIVNSMIERLREWYGLHYPELRISHHEKYVDLVLEHGDRSNFKDFKSSMGVDLRKEDVKILQSFAKQLKEMYELKSNLEEYLGKIVPEVIPNMNALLGTLLAAKLLSKAGSLEKLAKMPSSKIQLLGAEKSLFKFMKGQQKTVPKYGIIFIHPDISTAPKDKKGKVARLLAGKLALAVRADFYSKENISDKLLEDYKRKLKMI